LLVPVLVHVRVVAFVVASFVMTKLLPDFETDVMT
jgi:hypothetical protein